MSEQAGKIVLIGGAESYLSEAEYLRFKRMADKSGKFQTLASGVIINRDQIAAVYPGDMAKIQAIEDMAPPEIVEPGASDAAEFEQSELEAGETPETSRITGADIERIMEDTDISQAAFAASIGYSSASVRMAVKEGKVSAPMAEAILKKYGTILVPQE